jgi:hypothetical protein
VADELSRRAESSFVREGIRCTAEIPDTVELSIEIESGGDDEVEIEISWWPLASIHRSGSGL